MKRSLDRIITSHVGSLPRPEDLLAIASSDQAYEGRLASAVKDVVRRQLDHGIDVIDDGEFGKPDFVGYVNTRLGGFTHGEPSASAFALRDARHFPEYYETVRRARSGSNTLAQMYPPLVCTGPIRYVGHDALQRRPHPSRIWSVPIHRMHFAVVLIR